MLEGKVGDFSLPEIFQLIALTKKTGTLTISTTGQEGRVRFRAGEVSEAASDVRRLALGARLVAAGLVDESQLAAALEAKRDQGGEVLGLLLQHAAIEEGALHAFVREQIADAVADMLRFDEATFRFDTDDAAPEPLIDVQVATDQLVIEGNQRLAEWEAIRQHVPEATTVFAVAPAPLVDGTQVVVDADDWQVLALVDGRRPVHEIVELSGRSEYSTSKALAGLAARKLVEPCSDDDEGHPLSSLLARREVLRRLEELELSEHRPGPRKPAPATEHPDPEPASEDPPAGRLPAVPPAGGELDDPETLPGGDPPADPGEPATGEPPAGEPATGEPPAGEEPDGTAGGDTVPPAPSFEDGDALSLGDDDPAGGGSAPDRDPALGGGAPRGGDQGSGTIDRAQVARELAALGLDDGAGAGPSGARPSGPGPSGAAASPGQRAGGTEQGAGEQAPAAGRIVRDEDINKGLLLRLIDGVKGA